MIKELKNFAKKMITPLFIGTKDMENRGFRVYFIFYLCRDNGSIKPDDYLATYASKNLNDDDKDNIVAVQAGQGIFDPPIDLIGNIDLLPPDSE